MLNNFEIIEYCKKHNILLNDIFQEDSIKNINMNQKEFYYIINQESSQEGNGSHWVAFIKKKNKYFYYDSFAVLPVKPIINKFKGKRIGFTNFSHQPLKSTHCGWYCILFLKIMQQSNNLEDSFDKLIDNFEAFNDVINDKILRDLLKK